MIQNFERVELSDLITRVEEMKKAGYRLGQACATKRTDGKYSVLYSFDKDHVLHNIKVIVPEDFEMPSITGDYWSAFIYENEMHDLFGIKFHHLAVDYEGNFFKLSEPTPWNPQK